MLHKSLIRTEDMSKIIAVEPEVLAKMKREEPITAFDITETNTTKLSHGKTRYKQCAELYASRGLLFDMLNVNIENSGKDTAFLTDAQVKCVADLALNTCISFETTAYILNMRPATLMSIVYQASGVTYPQRALVTPLRAVAVTHLERVTDKKFDIRIKAIKKNFTVSEKQFYEDN